MKKSFFIVILAMVMLPNVSAQSYIRNMLSTNVATRDGVVVPVYTAKGGITEKSFTSFDFPGNESNVSSKVIFPKKYKAFDVKKDKISNFCLVPVQKDGRKTYSLYVMHNNNKACDMNEFSIRLEGDNLKCEQTEDGQYSRYSMKCTVFDLADGTCSSEGTIVVTHNASGQSVSIPYKFHWNQGVNYRSGSMAVLVSRVKSALKEPVYSILDVARGDLFVVSGNPFIDVSGIDGFNGANGYNGMNGINTYTYKDKDGKTHTVNGTRGYPGGNGQNGGNGFNGGHLLVLLGDSIQASAINCKWHGGKGGKGGKGGAGGIHGVGSGLTGSAPNGRDGADGLPGQDGAGKFISIANAEQHFKNIIDSVSVSNVAPYILVDISPKVHKGNSKKVADQDKKDAAAGAVEF